MLYEKVYNHSYIVLVVILSLITAVAALHKSETGNQTGSTIHFNQDKVFQIYKAPDCTCCDKYVTYLKKRGAIVKITVLAGEEIVNLKKKLGIPEDLWSCHTGILGEYVIEGHVPVEATMKLFQETNMVENLVGLALPGMPAGSPGMPGQPSTLLIVYYLTKYGESNVFWTSGST